MTPVDTARSISAVSARPHLTGGRIDLAWQNPPGSAFDPGQPFAGIRILRRERTFPLDPQDGTIVYDGPVVESVRGPRAGSADHILLHHLHGCREWKSPR